MKRVNEIHITGSELIVQDNKLIDSPRFLTLQEQKLFLFLISKLNPNDSYNDYRDIVFRISVNDFAQAIGVTSTTDIYRDVRNTIKRLMNKIISIHKIEDGNQTITDMPILSYAKYWIGKGYVDVKISEEIAPYLFELKSEYTQYKLSQITLLSSVYAIRIYEMLKKQEKLGNRTFFIDELRKKLAITDQQYSRFADFKRYILEIAKREINEKTDIVIDFKFKKSGRKIVAVEFDITPKNQKKAENKQKVLELYNHSSRSEYVDEIMQYGFQRTSVNRMLSGLEDHQIENALLAVKEQIQNGRCKTPKAMLRTALKECWTPLIRASIKTQEHKIPKISDISIDQVCEDSSVEKTEKKIQSGLQKKTGFFTFLNKMLNK